MKRINNMLVAVVISIICFEVGFVSKAYAKPISNTLKASINITGLEVSVGEGESYEFSSINAAIQRVMDGGVIKIKGGLYQEVEPLLDKNVTLLSEDGGYVDIIVPKDAPEYVNLKIGDKVTVNKEGVAPLSLKSALVNSDGSINELSTSNITFDAEKGKEVKIYLEKDIVNPLGFNKMNLMLKLNSDTNVILKKKENGLITAVSPDANNNYNLGDMKSNITVMLTFQRAGEYNADIWLDDGR